MRLLGAGSGLEHADHLKQLAQAYLSLGRPDVAAPLCRRALAAYRRDGDRQGEAWTLVNPGSWIEFVRGDFDAMLARVHEAARVMGPAAKIYFEAERKNCLAPCLLFLGRFDEARSEGQEAVTLAEQLDSHTQRA